MDELERRRRENRQREIDYGKTLMNLSELGTGQISLCIFPFVSLDGCVNNGASMRNHSSARSSLRRAMLLWAAGAAVLAFRTPELHAQCSGEDDPDSFGCQMQQAASLPSTTRSPASPAVLSMQEQPQQRSEEHTSELQSR